jgi:peptidoglycan/LPS O-acetylase OafA/YrhL
LVYFINAIILTLTVSGLTYFGFERPMNAYFRARRPSRHRAPKPAIEAVR